MQLIDSYNRPIRSLRVSVTDRCNFRCTYCMPPEGIELLPRAHFLTYAEIQRAVRILCHLGIRKVRLTGGEPLLRKDLADLVVMLRDLPGLEDLSLTTNGYHLPEAAVPLRDAGLRRINISLDSLDRDRFHEVTRVDAYDRVWEGINAAIAAGLKVKLNAVVLKDSPMDDLLAFARLAYDRGLDVRFIEFMPLCGQGWAADKVLPIAALRDAVMRTFPLEPDPKPRGSDVAETYKLNGGSVGFIGSLTEPFCDNCDRVRLGIDGRLQLCLFKDEMLELAPMLRGGAADSEIEEYLLRGVKLKPVGHGFSWDDPRNLSRPKIRTIGG